MRYKFFAILALLPVVAGCGGEAGTAREANERPGVVPFVTGVRLDEAKRALARRQIAARVHDLGLGPLLVESNWTVCEQWPDAGDRARSVDLYVQHFCEEEEFEDDDDF
jgi:hypothetical protein